MKKIFKFVSIICACAAVAAPFAAAAQSGDIIKPWTTMTDFNNSGFNYSNTATSTTNNWVATYTNVLYRPNCSAVARDGYTDANGNKVYDNVTGEQGNKYAYISYADGWTKPASGNNNPGILYYNGQTSTVNPKSNGGYCYGAVRYEADIRYDNTSETESGTQGGIYIFNNNSSSPVISVPTTKNVQAKKWYITRPTGSAGLAAVYYGKWYHIVIDADYSTKQVSYTLIDCETSEKVDSKSGTFASAYPLKPAMEIRGMGYANLSVDNVKVTKETYIIGDTSIKEEDSAVKATVTVGNDVYADSDTKFGSAVDTVSPAAVLALYDGSGNLISVDYKTMIFDGHSIITNGPTASEIKTFLNKEIDNKTIELSLAKPSEKYTAAVYMLSDMGNLVPYGEPVQFPIN